MKMFMSSDKKKLMSTENWDERMYNDSTGDVMTFEEFSQLTGYSLVEVPDNLIIPPEASDFENDTFIQTKFDDRYSEKLIDDIRKIRDKECFSVVNRSNLWYIKLTEEQKTELEEWYQEWLELPNKQKETKNKLKYPVKPSWV
jgi:hypothetical protein